jgi:hypothetical protein
MRSFNSNILQEMDPWKTSASLMYNAMVGLRVVWLGLHLLQRLLPLQPVLQFLCKPPGWVDSGYI